MEKIITFNHLSDLLATLKSGHKVLVGGVFDILHLGHIRFLQAAKKYGTVIVALESDQNVKKYKGVSRPIHTQKERAEVLTHLHTVDFVILLPPLVSDNDYYQLVKTVSPHTIVITEGDPQLTNKQKQSEAVGAKIVVVPKIKTPSTTQLAKLLELE
jgi:rfaE bifunctional protein nucleotidyltransferase chain/domain